MNKAEINRKIDYLYSLDKKISSIIICIFSYITEATKKYCYITKIMLGYVYIKKLSRNNFQGDF